MLPNIVKGANKKGVSWLYFVMYLILIVVVIVVITKVYKAIKNGANDVGNLAADTAKAAQTGIPLARLQQIRNTAEMLWTKGVVGYGSWYRPVNYDEEMFVQKINSMQSTVEVTILAQDYQEVAQESLATSLDECFKTSDIAKLKTGYYSTIKSV